MAEAVDATLSPEIKVFFSSPSFAYSYAYVVRPRFELLELKKLDVKQGSCI